MKSEYSIFERMKAPWLHPDKVKRGKIVDGIEDPSILMRVVIDDRLESLDSYGAKYLKLGAIQRIDRQDILRELIERKPRLIEDLRFPIAKMLTDIEYLEGLYRDESEQGMVRHVARDRLARLSDDQALLLELAADYSDEAAAKLSPESCRAFLDGEQPFEKRAGFFARVSKHVALDGSYRERFRTGECRRCNVEGPNDSRLEIVSEVFLRHHEANPDMMPTSDYSVYRVKRRCSVCGIELEREEQRD